MIWCQFYDIKILEIKEKSHIDTLKNYFIHCMKLNVMFREFQEKWDRMHPEMKCAIHHNSNTNWVLSQICCACLSGWIFVAAGGQLSVEKRLVVSRMWWGPEWESKNADNSLTADKLHSRVCWKDRTAEEVIPDMLMGPWLCLHCQECTASRNLYSITLSALDAGLCMVCLKLSMTQKTKGK